MQRMLTFHRTILASCLLGLLLISGCGEQQHPQAPLGSKLEGTQGATSLGKKTIGPSITTSSDTRVERYGLLNLALMQTENLAVSQLVKASAGGTLYLSEFKFYIPPGSLAKDTNISITMTSDKYIQVDFGPDGTQFNPPATMSVSYATANLQNTQSSKLSISWFDTATNKWVNIGGTVNQSTMTISAPISHFTEYTLSTR